MSRCRAEAIVRGFELGRTLVAWVLLGGLLVSPSYGQINEVQQTLGRFDQVRPLDPPTVNEREIQYGAHHSQTLSLMKAKGGDPAPLVVRMGGASYDENIRVRISLAWLPSFFFDNGFAFASVHARAEEDVKAPQRVADMASAVGELVRNSQKYGIDPSRIILIGRGSEGQFAALLATDPGYLTKVGVPFSSLKGVVIFNGDGFDIPHQISASDRYKARRIAKSMGRDVMMQELMSPMAHTETPNAPQFLFYVTKNSPELSLQAKAMASALAGTGSSADVVQIPKVTSRANRNYIGSPQNEYTRELLNFLRRSFDRPRAN